MHQRHSIGVVSIVVVLIGLTSFAGPLGAQSPLDYRSYPSGQLLWIWTPNGIMLYRYDTKALKHIALTEMGAQDSVLDVAENGGALWTVAANGLYQIDMSSSTIERIPGGPADLSGSKVAADIDYAWVVRHDTLWKFDKLSREWFAYGLGKHAMNQGNVIGAFSSGETVFIIAPSTVLHFSISDEKWSAYPRSGPSFSPHARFFPLKQTLIVVEGNTIYRYLMAKLSWDKVSAPSAIVDMHMSDEQLFFLTADGAFQYTASTAALRKLDIPDTRAMTCLSLQNDTTVTLSGEKSIVQFITTSRSFENIPYPPQLPGAFPNKIIKGDVLLYTDQLTLYNRATKTWELFSAPRGGKNAGFLSWDDRSLRLRMGDGAQQQLHGNITQRLKLIDGGMLTIDSTRERVFFYSPAKFGDDLFANLTSHTTFGGDRYMDITFKKETGKLPEKGLFYRGEDDDYLESVRLGTTSLTTPQSQTFPDVRYEGANAIVHSKSELATRDRKIVRAQAGTGLRTSKTMHAVLNYRPDGRYSIANFDTTKPLMILPGSLRITIDGEDIDTLQYSLVPTTGDLIFNRRDLIDPSSVIIATYKVQTIPDSGLGTVELLPENHFGEMQHASATVSPTEWISIQTNYATMRSREERMDSTGLDSLDNIIYKPGVHIGPRLHVANAMAPMEFRLDKQNLLLKMTPELSYETSKQAAAGGFSLQSRLGDWALGKATSFFLDMNFFDSAYTATDDISRGYGASKGGFSAKLTHDIMTELPLSFSFADRSSRYGKEQYSEAMVGAHFQNMPKLDVSLSYNMIDADNSVQFRSDTTADTLVLDRDKLKAKARLYEPSSPLLQSLLHCNKVSYDVSYAIFGSHRESDLDPYDTMVNPDKKMPGGGSITYTSVSLSPVPSLTFSGLLTSKSNYQDSLIDSTHAVSLHRIETTPYYMLQAIDAIPGFDISGIYAADYTGQGFSDTANVFSYDSGRVSIQRQFMIIMKPGTWTRSLSWVAPRFGMSADLSCRFDSTAKATAASILFGTTGRQEFNLTTRFGAHFYPTNEIQFRQENAISQSTSRVANPIGNFYSFNDLKWWFGANRLWQTRAEYNDIATDTVFVDISGAPTGTLPGDTLSLKKKKLLKMFTFYDANWSAWLHTNEKFAADFTRMDSSFVGEDSTWQSARIDRLNFGPEVMVSFNIQQVGPIKMLINGHSGKIAWTRENGRYKKGSSISYSTFMELILKPNISFETNHALTWTPGVATYNGDLSVSLLF